MPRIIIVEDEAVASMHLEEILTARGHEVVGLASNAEDALHIAKVEVPDLALVDIALEGPRDGISLAFDLRQELSIAIVFVTSFADEATVQRAIAIRPNGYLVKPFNSASIHAAVETALANFVAEQHVLDPKKLIGAMEGPGKLPLQAVEQVKRYIASRFDQPISIAELAEVANVSVFHFCRAFKSATGVTPYRYVVNERIEEGKRLLRTTDASVMDIALAVGFENHAHFSSTFKKQVGVTPSAWRKA